MDSTNRWLPAVTQIRDVLKHRGRLNLIAGDPSDGTLFQLPGWPRSAPALESVLLDPERTNLVGFVLYSAFVLTQILAQLNELVLRMAAHVGVKLITEPLSMWYGNFKKPAHNMDRLQQMMRSSADGY